MVEWFLPSVQRHSIIPFYQFSNLIDTYHNSFRMPSSIITTDDLREFKLELLEEITKLISGPRSHKVKKYLKSYEVREMLNISTGTLHNLRVNGTLPFTKVGNILLYDQEDILEILQANKTNA